MASSSSYAPNESNSTIIREETWLQGILLSNFLFGIQTTLCVMAFYAVLQRRATQHSRMRIVLSVYTAVLFALTGAGQGLMINWIQMGFITQRNYPGGPDAFLSEAWSIPVNLALSVLVVFANWTMESLLVWRCYVVCSTGERPWWLGVAIPLFLLITVFVNGSLLVDETIHTTPSTTRIVSYGICSLALNFIATGFIARRLLVHRHRVVSQLGRAHGHPYVTIATVVVESAAVYTGFLIIVIVAYVIKSPATILLQQAVVQVQTITSVFIIWRIARGKGWTRSTDMELMSAAVLSLDTRVEPPSQLNVMQLEVPSTGRDEAHEESIQRTEGERNVSFLTAGEV